MKDIYGRLTSSGRGKVLSSSMAAFPRNNYTLYYRILDDCLRDNFGIFGIRYLEGKNCVSCTRIFYGDNMIASIFADALLSLYQKEVLLEALYIPELRTRIKNRTSQKDAVTGVANYVADKIVYDLIKGIKEKNKVHCGTALEEGYGICHDYAEAFARLIALIPINEQGIVDWTSGTQNIIKTNIVSSDTHAWNTLTHDGTTHQLDVCYYDTTRDQRWLDMGAAEQSEMHHHIGDSSNGLAYLR